ncbi:MAG: metallophosphoesterase family protein [Gemmatimonadetes bacterium]|nr:metallophosphoesterase family protein [Gemmatimonadota bacterium]NNL30171.1 metallophosphoesterase family protein [Gemmatimonadota bacterium]
MTDTTKRGSLAVGVISDTHGLLRPSAVAALDGSDVILHAGDVGGQDILDALGEIAPVHAVRGNTDRGPWAELLPRTEIVSLQGAQIYMVHDVEDLDLDPAAADFDMVVYGHSHRPDVTTREGVVYFNPGAAGHRRFNLPVTVGRVPVTPSGMGDPEIVHIEAAS